MVIEEEEATKRSTKRAMNEEREVDDKRGIDEGRGGHLICG